MIFPCPPPAALSTPVLVDCPFRFDQIVKIFFVRRQTADVFATKASINVLATWTPLLAAIDDTKVVASPVFSNLVIPNGAGQFSGGNDNTTFNGIREYYGEDTQLVTGEFRNTDPKSIASLKAYTPESLVNSVGRSNLEIMMLNKDNVLYLNSHLPGTGYHGINIFNWRVGGRGSAGLKTPDLNQFSFDLPAGWDDNLVAVPIIGFDAITLIN